MMLKQNETIQKIMSNIPYIICITMVSGLLLYTIFIQQIILQISITQNILLCSVFVAIISSFFTMQKKISLDQKMEIFYSGIRNVDSVRLYCLIIALATLHYLTGSTNSSLIAATLGLIYIPACMMMPTIFMLTAFAQATLLSLPTTIVIMLPIGFGIAQSLHSNSGVMAVTIIIGAVCGHHLTTFFKNVIIDRSNLLAKLQQKNNFLIVCVIVAICLLALIVPHTPLHKAMIQLLATNICWHSFLLLIPYASLFIAAVYRMNIVANIMVASCVAMAIKICYFNMPIVQTFMNVFVGFCHDATMPGMLILNMMLAGLAAMVRYNHGFDYLESMKNMYRKK